jgi:hypothetical protein
VARSGCFVVQIRVRGELGPAAVAIFDDLRVTNPADGTTLLEGELVDQAAVHGLLGRIRDLGLSLITVETMAAPSDA